MLRLHAVPVLIGLFAATAPLAGQNPDAARTVIDRDAASPLAKDVDFPASKTAVYRIAYAVNVGPEKPDSVVPGFRSAGNFMYVANANGVPRANQKLAIVVWGTATHSLLKNDAYRGARGVDNASIPLLQALHDAGVQVIVCGEALINRKLDRRDLLPFVKVAPTASMALATLHTEGYVIFRP
jgi:intracellular sulfur oxidation DsrE/DsrF family protein